MSRISAWKMGDSELEKKVLALIQATKELAMEIAQLKVDNEYLWHDNENLRRRYKNQKLENENLRNQCGNLKHDNEYLKYQLEPILRGRNEGGTQGAVSALMRTIREQKKDVQRLKVDHEQMRDEKESLEHQYESLERESGILRDRCEKLAIDQEDVRDRLQPVVPQADENMLEVNVSALIAQAQDNGNRIAQLKAVNETLWLENKYQTLKFENVKHDYENLRHQCENLNHANEHLKYKLQQYLLPIIPPTCQTLADLRQETGPYLVDPDGILVGDPPIQVLCDMEYDPVSTIVLHDSMEVDTEIDHCADPGCFSRNITYEASLKQMVALIDRSQSCYQEIGYDCVSAALTTGVTHNVWWVDRHGEPQFYWHGSDPTERVCMCGLSEDCIDPDLPCNCDSEMPKRESDLGVITNTTALPITQLRFGGLQHPEVTNDKYGLESGHLKFENTVFALVTKTKELSKDITRLKVDNAHFWNDNEILRNQYEKLKQENENLRQGHKNLKDQNDNLRQDHENLKHECENLKHECENLKRDSVSLKQDNEIFESQLREYQRVRDEETKLQQNNVEGRLLYLEAIALQIAPQTCQTLADLGVTKAGNYFVDPDGILVGDPPIQVFCDMETDPVSTIVQHDAMKTDAEIDNCADPGCFSRNIKYNASLKQMVALIDQSQSCNQRIKYDCLSAPLRSGDIQHAWWVDRHGKSHYYWDGSNATEHVCKCGLSNSCVDTNLPCNCDAGAPGRGSDSGEITNATALPITQLRFGGLKFQNQKANYTLGGLICKGKPSPGKSAKGKAPQPQQPSGSCSSLRQSGNGYTGYHLIRRKEGRLDVVFCRMDLEETDPEFQIETDARIAEKAVYFDAFGKSSRVGETTGPISFEGTEVNMGNAMEPKGGVFTVPLDGIYAFHFHYYAQNYTAAINLRLNGDARGHLRSSGNDHKIPGQSILLHLKRGDKVDAYLALGTIHTDPHRYVHFVGYLLYPM
ncbi:unnamed protein product [Darwinula stevensoni]|uniref:C1q domain-containing protein n=1 Tax=Darwinula stevensoni TaxID=69355 RepID=A0A7R9A5C7_9CRUS|nr:unnamed protein product [Darwinula stevensoni]CAG0886202.1 unnamed protein product [Darwinula stevensoni]